MNSSNIGRIPHENLASVCVPAGIGDISWVYSKMCHFRRMTGVEVVMHIASKGELNRGAELVEMFPEVHFGGYLDTRTSHECIIQSLPPDWKATSGGLGLIRYPGHIVNMGANLHLEQGRPLRDIWPLLPVDYHYPLDFPATSVAHSAARLSRLPQPWVSIYVSNREKDKQRAGGWSLWSAGQWGWFLRELRKLPGLETCGFVFLGATYDADKTSEVGALVHDLPQVSLIGEPLAVSLAALRMCRLAVSYASGIGVLSNVLRVPGLMLMPWLLKGLELSYADPIDLDFTYRAWADPTPAEALHFLATRTVPIVFG